MNKKILGLTILVIISSTMIHGLDTGIYKSFNIFPVANLDDMECALVLQTCLGYEIKTEKKGTYAIQGAYKNNLLMFTLDTTMFLYDTITISGIWSYYGLTLTYDYYCNFPFYDEEFYKRLGSEIRIEFTKSF